MAGKPDDLDDEPPKGMKSKPTPKKDDRPAISDKSTSIPGPSLHDADDQLAFRMIGSAAGLLRKMRS